MKKNRDEIIEEHISAIHNITNHQLLSNAMVKCTRSAK
jgi:hypothetical protein